VKTLPVGISTGWPVTKHIARCALLRSPAGIFNFFISADAASWILSETFFMNFDLRSLPSPLSPSLIMMAIMLMVGGPPTFTGMPIGIVMRVEVGRKKVFFGGFFALRGGEGIPMDWQLKVGMAMRLRGSPSPSTVALPIKTSHSFPGGMVKAPPIGK